MTAAVRNRLHPSGRIDQRERPYQAPASADVPAHMAQLLQWLNQAEPVDALVRAAIAHLWFETIEPFEDGNGRMGRALAEQLLAQDPLGQQRLFSLLAQFANDREGYDSKLRAATTQPKLDVTPWVQWFVARVQAAYLAAEQELEQLATLGLLEKTGEGRGTRYQLVVCN